MYKSLVYIPILLIITVFSCKDKNTLGTQNSPNHEQNKIIFKVDERTEFFRTIFNLAVQEDLPADIAPCKTEYLTQINSYFEPFKNHALLKYIYDHETMGIDFPTIGLMYDTLENFEMDTIYSKEFPIYGVSKQDMDSMRPLLIDFYTKTDFKSFYNNSKAYYEKAVENVQMQLDKEQLFNTITNFYQGEENGMELIVIVELTNNANNKAVSYYDKYNPKKRAVIVANICDDPNEPTAQNTILELDNNLKARIYHEASHLYTDKLLDKYIGELDQYQPICDDCNDVELKDKVDHLIVYPLQELISYREFGKHDGHDFYLNKCQDVRKDIYIKLSEYHPEDGIPFEETYEACINLIQLSASEK
ncbi:DUF4932 domain-containing protein [Bizionia arctica]|uniref:DUF4932 domain-containing protein n=1 Tax=Bizionia arctica TaxID=1495645 RepID=A0A917GBJ0_9FLAO|nr:DUF4932 domain-containing protein [Bizionia arctica]GGG36010.1 hypothetical protein GCM10010976_04660 [Bizionia arctica]